MILSSEYKIEDLPAILKEETDSLKAILAGHPFISEKVNIDALANELKTVLARQITKADSSDPAIQTLRKQLSIKFVHWKKYECNENFDNNIADLIQFSQMDDFKKVRVQWAKFKSKYMLWAKNFLAILNTIKLSSKAQWFSVKDYASVLAKLELNEVCVDDIKEDYENSTSLH